MKDINEVRPSSISHIVGQKSVTEQVRVALDACQIDAKRFDHALLVGAPGLGKTQISQTICAEMATDYCEYLGSSIESPATLNSILIAATDRSLIFLDEAHELDIRLQTALYLALDKREVILQPSRKGSTPMVMPIADFTLLLATTDEYQLLQPLRDRMRLVLRFEFYSEDELVKILRFRLQSLDWLFDDAMLPVIAERSRGTPRLALRLAQAAFRVARSEGSHTITRRHLERACQLDGIDSYGCGPNEQRYLRIVGEGPCRLNVIASRLGLPTRTVSEVVEPFLIRSALITKDGSGKRQLTALGYQHLENVSESIV